jgi:frataxin-like iron-binding protein CyaY
MQLRDLVTLNARILAAGVQSLIPCLIGETGVGKTSRVAQLAAVLGLPVLRVLPGTETPEDLLGYPRAIRSGDGTWVVQPLPREELHRAVQEPLVLLVDELDKAREETLSALLTLFAERRVRNLTLHPGSVIVAAMQPVEPAVWLASKTGEALAARLLFIPCTAGEAWSHLRDRYGLSLKFLPETETPVLPILPKPSPRVIEYALNLAREMLTAGVSDEEILSTLRGCLEPHFAAELLDEVKSSDLYDPFDRLAAEGRLREWAAAAPAGELVPHLIDCAKHDWPATVAAIERVLVELDPDAATAAMRSFLSSFHAAVEAAGGTLEIPDGLSEEEGADLLETALRRVARAWVERGKAPTVSADAPADGGARVDTMDTLRPLIDAVKESFPEDEAE